MLKDAIENQSQNMRKEERCPGSNRRKLQEAKALGETIENHSITTAGPAYKKWACAPQNIIM